MSEIMDLKDLTVNTRDLVGRLRTICGDDEQAFLDTLEGCSDVHEAASRVIRWMNEQEAHAGAMKGLASTYSARSKVFDNRVDGARNALFHLLQYLGVRTMPLPEATLSVVSGKVKVMGEPDADKLPDNLVRVKREPDMAAIRAALEAKQEVPGCSLSNTAPTLAVRTR